MGGSLIIGILISIPLAMICVYNKKLATIIISFSNLVQAVPSFAVVALVVPLMGLGFRPAILAILLRVFLPVIKNTYIGLTSVNPSLVEFAEGQGLTWWQIMKHIRLPHAYPALFAGIKFAAILANSIAILTAIIGAGGYGENVFYYISQFNVPKLIWSVVPVIIIAIIVELFFIYIEHKVTPPPLRASFGLKKKMPVYQ